MKVTVKEVLTTDYLWNRMDLEEKIEFLELIGCEFFEKDYYPPTYDEVEQERESFLKHPMDDLIHDLREQKKNQSKKKSLSK